MAGKNIKLNPEETLGHVNKIVATMAEVSVPGPVPPPWPPTEIQSQVPQPGLTNL